MTKSQMDLLVTRLDTRSMREYSNYIVEPYHRHPAFTDNSCISWEVRLYPKFKSISELGAIITEAEKAVDHLIIYAHFGDKGYIVFI